MSNQKPRVLKDYEKLTTEIQEQIKLVYPNGYSQNLISFTNKEGKKVSALPFETEDKHYLIRMTVQEAQQIISDDDDYDDDGILKDDTKGEYEDKYSEIDYLSDQIPDGDDDDEKED
ncbi:hypothetical protein [Flexithrix dorotheae]|uniref:hypothetical protein n=1 Tax=Flexithrix dorotheae TaxID=70993 RepID=UPI00037211E3|nr:hypothetical protein [Flexithrix dorotheae]